MKLKRSAINAKDLMRNLTVLVNEVRELTEEEDEFIYAGIDRVLYIMRCSPIVSKIAYSKEPFVTLSVLIERRLNEAFTLYALTHPSVVNLSANLVSTAVDLMKGTKKFKMMEIEDRTILTKTFVRMTMLYGFNLINLYAYDDMYKVLVPHTDPETIRVNFDAIVKYHLYDVSKHPSHDARQKARVMLHRARVIAHDIYDGAVYTNYNYSPYVMEADNTYRYNIQKPVSGETVKISMPLDSADYAKIEAMHLRKYNRLISKEEIDSLVASGKIEDMYSSVYDEGYLKGEKFNVEVDKKITERAIMTTEILNEIDKLIVEIKVELPDQEALLRIFMLVGHVLSAPSSNKQDPVYIQSELKSLLEYNEEIITKAVNNLHKAIFDLNDPYAMFIAIMDAREIIIMHKNGHEYADTVSKRTDLVDEVLPKLSKHMKEESNKARVEAARLAYDLIDLDPNDPETSLHLLNSINTIPDSTGYDNHIGSFLNYVNKTVAAGEESNVEEVYNEFIKCMNNSVEFHKRHADTSNIITKDNSGNPVLDTEILNDKVNRVSNKIANVMVEDTCQNIATSPEAISTIATEVTNEMAIEIEKIANESGISEEEIKSALNDYMGSEEAKSLLSELAPEQVSGPHERMAEVILKEVSEGLANIDNAPKPKRKTSKKKTEVAEAIDAHNKNSDK